MLEPKLTLSFMEMCYQACCYGRTEPTHFVMSQERREELRALIMGTPHVPEHWKVVNGPLEFNNAQIIGLPNFTDTHLWVVNIERPEHPGLNHRFTITEGWPG